MICVGAPDKQTKCRRTKNSSVLRQPEGRAWAQPFKNPDMQLLIWTGALILTLCWMCWSKAVRIWALCFRWDTWLDFFWAVQLFALSWLADNQSYFWVEDAFSLLAWTAATKNEHATDTFTHFNLFCVTFFPCWKGYFSILLICCICLSLLTVCSQHRSSQLLCFIETFTVRSLRSFSWVVLSERHCPCVLCPSTHSLLLFKDNCKWCSHM